MSAKVEKLENSMIKLTIEVSAERFEEGMKFAYNKNKKRIVVPGFRKGKAPRKLIERTYGKGVFYEDAANHVIPDAYDKAVEENELDVVSRPEIDVEQIEAGKPFIFTAEVAVKPEVELGEYKGLEVEKKEVEVTDEEVDNELNAVAEQNARKINVTDRAVEDKDELKIDFEGFVDGVAFEGGKAEDYSLVIGSHSFIDTFEDQLIGKNIDEEVEVNVTFPEDYNKEELQGKPAMFKVTVKEISVKELPAIDDEFAKDVSDFDTLDEYKADLKAKAIERKEKTAKQEMEDALLEKAVENSKMELPAAMVQNESEMMINNFANTLRYQGMSLEQYLSFTGSNMVAFKDSLKPEAEKRVKGSLVLEAIAKAENIEVNEDDVEAELANMAKTYNMEIEKLKESINENELEHIKEDMKNKKALDLLVENAKEA